MGWAVDRGRTNSLDDTLVFDKYPNELVPNTMQQLKLFMQNWTNGMAEQVITYNVHNGLDAWRKLCHDQLPATNHHKEVPMNEFNELG